MGVGGYCADNDKDSVAFAFNNPSDFCVFRLVTVQVWLSCGYTGVGFGAVSFEFVIFCRNSSRRSAFLSEFQVALGGFGLGSNFGKGGGFTFSWMPHGSFFSPNSAVSLNGFFGGNHVVIRIDVYDAICDGKVHHRTVFDGDRNGVRNAHYGDGLHKMSF